jgi:TP901 family phage tail tape measure protein
MAAQQSTHLIGIGYKVEAGGVDEWAKQSARVRNEARSTATDIDKADKAIGIIQATIANIARASAVAMAPVIAFVAAVSAIPAALAIVSVAAMAATSPWLEFERGLVGVGKTAGIQGSNLEALGRGIENLSTAGDIPSKTDELLEIAEAAGSLGVTGSENILRFTATLAKLGAASNLQGQAGAAALAEILTITSEGPAKVEQLASVIVALGNAYAATEAQIAGHAGDIARSTAIYGVSSTEAAALAAVLASMGVQAQLAGSATGRALRVIETAIITGGENMRQLSRITGASATEIEKAWESGPINALTLMLEGLNKIKAAGGSVSESLSSVGLDGEEIAKVLPVLAKNLDVLAAARATAAKEAEHATALDNEAARASQTLSVQVAVLGNRFEQMARTIGQQLAPVVMDAVKQAQEWLSANQGLAKQIGGDLATALGVAVKVVAFLAENISLLDNALVAITAGSFVAWLLMIAPSIGTVTATIGTWASAQLAAAAATTTTAGATIAHAAAVAASVPAVATLTASTAALAGATAAEGLVMATAAEGQAAYAATGALAASSELLLAGSVAATAAPLAGQQLLLQAATVATVELTLAQRAMVLTTAALRAAWAGMLATLEAHPIILIATALALLAGGLYALYEKYQETEAAAAAYHDELESGRILVNGQRAAHEELIDTLSDEIAKRAEYSRSLETQQRRLEELLIAQQRLRAAGSDPAAYGAARNQANELIGGSGSGMVSTLEKVNAEVDKLRAEIDQANIGWAQSGDEILAIQARLEELTGERAIKLAADMQAQRARIAEMLSDLAQIKQSQLEISDVAMFAGTDAGVATLNALSNKLEIVYSNLDAARRGFAGMGQDLDALRPKIEALIDASTQGGGNLDQGKKLLGTLYTGQELADQIAMLEAVYESNQRNREAMAAEESARKRIQQATADQAKRYQELRVELIAAGTANQFVIAQQLISVEAGDAAVRSTEREARARSQTKGLMAGQAADIKHLIELRDQEEQQIAASRVVAISERQKAANDAITLAYGRNFAAGRQAEAQMQREADVRRALEGVVKEQRAAVEAATRAELDSASASAAAAEVAQLQKEAFELQAVNLARANGEGAARRLADAIAVQNIATEASAGFFGLEADAIERAALARERAETAGRGADEIASLREEARYLEDISRLRRGDFDTLRDYEKAVADINLQREISVKLVELEADKNRELYAVMADGFQFEDIFLSEEIVSRYRDRAAEIIKLLTDIADKNKQIDDDSDQGSTRLDKWVETAGVLKDVLGDVDEQFSKILDSVLQLVEGMGQASTAANNYAGNVTAAVASANLVGAIGEQVTGPKNYGAEGAMIGALVGAVLAAVFTWGIGTAGGAALGGAIGGAIGSFISKGSDEFLGQIRLAGDHATGQMKLAEGAMGQTGRQYMDAISRGINAAVDALGGDLVSLPGISIKVREGVYSVFSGGITARFDSMNEAMDFAILQALKNGEIDGIADEVRLAIQNSTAESFQNMSADLDLAKWISRLPDIGLEAGKGAEAVMDAIEGYHSAFRRATQLGIETEKITQWFARSLQNTRNSILGITETDRERITREAEAFNREIVIIKAEQEVKQAELLIKKAQLEAQIAILGSEIDLAQAEARLDWQIVQGYGDYVSDRAQVAGLEIDIYNALREQLAATITGIAATAGILAGLPAIITPGEIEDAIGRAGGGYSAPDTSAADAAREREQLIQTLKDLASVNVPDFDKALQDLADKFAEAQANAERLGITQAEIDKARLEQATALARKIRDSVKDFLSPESGGQFGMSDWQKQAADLRDRLAEAFRQSQLLAAQEGFRALTLEELAAATARANRALAEQARDSLADPIQATRNDLAKLGSTLEFLRDQIAKGIFTAAEGADIFAGAMRQAESTVLDLAAALLEQMGFEEEASGIRAALAEAEFVAKVAQLNILVQGYIALNLLSQETVDRLNGLLGIINDPTNWPDFYAPPPPPANNNQPDNGQNEAERQAEEDARRRQAILDQIAEWERIGESQAISTLRDLNETFAEMQADARRLGIDMDRLSAAYAHAVEAFWDDTLAPWEDHSQETIGAGLAEIQEQFAGFYAAAQQYGGDIERIRRANQQAINNFWEDVLGPLRDWRDELTQGSLGSSSPEERLFSAQRAFADIAQRALGGDISAMQGLPDAISAYLEQARAMYGSGADYQAIYAAVQQVIGQVLAMGPSGTVPPPGPTMPPPYDPVGNLLSYKPRPADAVPAQGIPPLPAAEQAAIRESAERRELQEDMRAMVARLDRLITLMERNQAAQADAVADTRRQAEHNAVVVREVRGVVDYLQSEALRKGGIGPGSGFRKAG